MESGETKLAVSVLVVVLVGVALVGAATATAAAQSTTPSPNADFNVTEGEGSFSIEIEDPGNLDALQLFAPDGNRSMEAVSVLRGGTTLRISDSPDLNTTILDPADLSLGNSVRARDVLGDSLESGYTVDKETFECVTLHDGYNFAGISISSSQNHPCHAPVLGHFEALGVVSFNPSLDLGSSEDGKPVPITYQEGTYELVGTVDGNTEVVETVTVGNDDDGGLSSGNPFSDSGNSPAERGTVINRIVEWNLNGEIDGSSYTRQEIINFIVEWNFAQ